jgi:sec-independent protein translocase protein TatA
MPELIIGLVVILLLFGAKRVPELARGLGSGVREFKKGTQEGEIEDKKKKEEAKKSSSKQARASTTTRPSWRKMLPSRPRRPSRSIARSLKGS